MTIGNLVRPNSEIQFMPLPHPWAWPLQQPLSKYFRNDWTCHVNYLDDLDPSIASGGPSIKLVQAIIKIIIFLAWIPLRKRKNGNFLPLVSSVPKWLASLLIHSQKYYLGWHHCRKFPLRYRAPEQSASSKPRALRRASHSYYSFTNINTNGRDIASGIKLSKYEDDLWLIQLANREKSESCLEVVTNFGKGDWVVNRCNPLPPPYALQKLPCP